MARAKFNATSFLIRWLVALALVLATFNPTQYSFLHRVAGAGSQTGFNTDHMPYKVLIGAVLAVFYVIYLRATWRSIGAIGVVLAIVVLSALIWVLIDIELLDLHGGTALTWVLLVLFATVMAVGLSWSHIRRRVSGQVDADVVDE